VAVRLLSLLQQRPYDHVVPGWPAGRPRRSTGPALAHGYRVLGFDSAVGGDEVFAQLVLARIIEPTSKLDGARVLEEAGVEAVSYRTVKRRLPEYAKQARRR
jgi:hypothetical protein